MVMATHQAPPNGHLPKGATRSFPAWLDTLTGREVLVSLLWILQVKDEGAIRVSTFGTTSSTSMDEEGGVGWVGGHVRAIFNVLVFSPFDLKIERKCRRFPESSNVIWKTSEKSSILIEEVVWWSLKWEYAGLKVERCQEGGGIPASVLSSLSLRLSGQKWRRSPKLQMCQCDMRQDWQSWRQHSSKTLIFTNRLAGVNGVAESREVWWWMIGLQQQGTRENYYCLDWLAMSSQSSSCMCVCSASKWLATSSWHFHFIIFATMVTPLPPSSSSLQIQNQSCHCSQYFPPWEAWEHLYLVPGTSSTSLSLKRSQHNKVYKENSAHSQQGHKRSIPDNSIDI